MTIQTSLWDSITRKISISAITGYQKHISPHKGFACAHRILYGGDSCSQYIKRIIAKEGLKTALLKSRLRFQSCKQANLILRSQSVETEEGRQNTKKSRKSCQNSFNDTILPECCVEISCDSSLSLCEPDCSSLECVAADCGCLDFGICSW
jgi:putative component of membrane protein insertase Oxa1/YidC/SpoIIIJ protein YidD